MYLRMKSALFSLTLFWFTPLGPWLRNVVSHTDGGRSSLNNVNMVYIDVQKKDCFFSYIMNASQCTTLDIWGKKRKITNWKNVRGHGYGSLRYNV